MGRRFDLIESTRASESLALLHISSVVLSLATQILPIVSTDVRERLGWISISIINEYVL